MRYALLFAVALHIGCAAPIEEPNTSVADKELGVETNSETCPYKCTNSAVCKSKCGSIYRCNTTGVEGTCTSTIQPLDGEFNPDAQTKSCPYFCYDDSSCVASCGPNYTCHQYSTWGDCSMVKPK